MPKTNCATSCPFCGNSGSKVTHTTHGETFAAGVTVVFVRRRRVCSSCGLPYTTRELPEENPTGNAIDSVPVPIRNM